MDYSELQRDLDQGMRLTEVGEKHFKLYLQHSKAIQQYRLMKMQPRDFKTMVVFCYGPRNTGKTYWVKQMDPNYFRKPIGHWMDGYDGQETVLYDDFTGTGFGSIKDHLAAFDKYKYTAKVHFGFCQWRPRQIFITCNVKPEELFPKLQEDAPELVRAFWSRVEYIIEFKERQSATSPPIIEYKDDYDAWHIMDMEWHSGFKRGH